MDTKILTICSIIAVAMLLQACPIDDLPCEGVDENRYIISNPGLLSVYPEQTTFEVGDTIWVESSISSQQTTNTGNEVDIYEELGIEDMILEMTLIENLPNDTIGGTVYFNDIPHVTQTVINAGESNIRTTNDGQQVMDLYYHYNNSNYTIDIGFILNKKGYYFFNNEHSERIRIIASVGNGCGEKYSIYTSLANPNHGYAYEFEVVE